MGRNKKPCKSGASSERDKRGRFSPGNAAASKYREEYADMLIEYFNRKPNTLERKLVRVGGGVEERPVYVPCEYPTLEGFAASIGVTTDTLRNWCDKYSRFRHNYMRARELQRAILTINAIMGLYPAGPAIFEAVNHHGMTYKSRVEGSVTFRVDLPKDVDEESN